MKYRIYITCALAYMSFSIMAQSGIEYRNSFEAKVQCHLKDSNDIFQISDDLILSGGLAEHEAHIDAVTVSEGNMSIVLGLPKLGNREYFELLFEISVGGRTFAAPPESLSQHLIPGREQSASYEIVWFNVIEDVPLLGLFELTMTADFYGEYFDCNRELTVNPKARIPYYIAGASGLAMIGISELVLIPRAEEEYKRYVGQIVGEDKLGIAPSEQEHDSGPKGVHEAEDHLADVLNKESTANIVRTAGQVIIAGSAVLFVVQHLKYKRLQKQSRRYCPPPAITFAPSYETTVAGSVAGVSMSIRF